MTYDPYSLERELEDERAYDFGPFGDPRRCPVHPGMKTSSDDGLHDAPCLRCEYEMEADAAQRDWEAACMAMGLDPQAESARMAAEAAQAEAELAAANEARWKAAMEAGHILF